MYQHHLPYLLKYFLLKGPQQIATLFTFPKKCPDMRGI